jgi:hypothetical protein
MAGVPFGYRAVSLVARHFDLHVCWSDAGLLQKEKGLMPYIIAITVIAVGLWILKPHRHRYAGTTYFRWRCEHCKKRNAGLQL